MFFFLNYSFFNNLHISKHELHYRKCQKEYFMCIWIDQGDVHPDPSHSCQNFWFSDTKYGFLLILNIRASRASCKWYSKQSSSKAVALMLRKVLKTLQAPLIIFYLAFEINCLSTLCCFLLDFIIFSLWNTEFLQNKQMFKD